MNVAIVQARMGSSRLPGKVMLDLNGQPVLAHVLARARAIPGLDAVCCAIPEGPDNDALADLAQSLGASVARGPEQDVLARYVLAARSSGAQVVMRITSDCPLLDPEVSGQVLAAFLETRPAYCSNIEPRSWPRGYDTEVFSAETLERAAREAREPREREHVTPWLREHTRLERRNVALEKHGFSDWRWTLDYAQDLEFMRAVLSRLPPFPHLPAFAELSAVVEQNPQLAAINADLE